MIRRRSARLLALQNRAEEGEQEEGELCNLLEGFRTMFTQTIVLKGRGIDESDQSKERDFYAALREALRRQVSASTAEEKVEKLKTRLPVSGTDGFYALKPEERFFWMKTAFPSWDVSDIANIGASMSGIRSSMSPKRLRSSTSSVSFSYRELGSSALQAAVEDKLPESVDEDRADKIWPLTNWMTDMTSGNSMVKMLELMEFTDCNFYLQDVSSVESVCGKGKMPDLLMILKDHQPSSYSTGAIVCLASRYDINDSVGEAIHYGKSFLREAGSMRSFIWVGVTDLLHIKWFKVIESEKIRASCTRSVATSKVRESLCAFLVADPCSLGMSVRLQKELGMPSGWVVRKVLGTGRTSFVYEVEFESRRYALKVPKQKNISLVDDFAFLKVLAGFKGVPKVHSKIREMLVLQPVGIPFSISNVKSCGLKFSLAQLVDILRAVHSRGVVNRDIRMENIMIAEGSLYILDWGFAAELGKAQPFAGCLHTSSDEVLAQITEGKRELIVYNAADDLIALVRCMVMVFVQEIADGLRSLGCGSSQTYASTLQAFWKDKIAKYRFWKCAETEAKNGDYDAVKTSLDSIAGFI